jgi:hypothetical protein
VARKSACITFRRSALYNQNVVDAARTVLTVGLPTLAVLVGILVNDARLNDLRGYINNRFDALQQILDARLRHLEEDH